MATTVKNSLGIASLLVNGILSIKPLANVAKHQARQMMIKRGEKIGVSWTKEVEKLRQVDWNEKSAKVENHQIKYPDYYLTSFHAYEEGNLNWDSALELEVAAKAVHAKNWKDAGALGDFRLRESYHEILKKQLPNIPTNILDVDYSVGMSSFALEEIYPQSEVIGLDLFPYFLAVAHYHCELQQGRINWVHAAAESTGLPNNYFDLVSIFIVCHELPESATRQIIQEVQR
jgi:2-polyprenyl-3-methyl-5-hydroxy-6-metoxy-1,4-benzoquinol methylase